MRTRFDEQLELLNKDLVLMGVMCEKVISLSSQALLDGNAQTAEKVASIGAEIDEKERTIEAFCLKLLLQQQPVARDLRQISAALKMVTDMERIGNQAGDIAEMIPFLKEKGGEGCEPIGKMALETSAMVTNSINAFVKQDVQAARAVIAHDDVVDDLFRQVRESLIKMIRSHPDQGDYAMDLLIIAKHFERTGDHAVNIAEWVIFSVTGVHNGEVEL